MTTAQIVLSLVLATMVFSVALELRVADFQGVAAILVPPSLSKHATK